MFNIALMCYSIISFQQWKSMAKIDKEKYKEPRTPILRQFKRKHDATEPDLEKQFESDQAKTNNKLAKFSAPE